MWDFREQGSEMHDQDQPPPPPAPSLKSMGKGINFFSHINAKVRHSTAMSGKKHAPLCISQNKVVNHAAFITQTLHSFNLF